MDKKILALTDTFPIPVRIVIEVRSSARISLGKKQITLRIPKGMPQSQRNQTALELLTWAQNTIDKKKLYNSQEGICFISGQVLRIFEKEYVLVLQEVKGRRGTIHFSQNQVNITIPEELMSLPDERNAWVHDLLKKGLQQFFLPQIQERTYQLNKQFFNASYNKVMLRYTTSRWGSCSSKGNISLSTRLLFAPQKSIDYVIIHELAHRFEMNHSPKFWALVEKAMPDYKIHETWLKENGKYINY